MTYDSFMAFISPAQPLGGLLREWRQRRRLSQLDLAIEAEVSARHLSFLETGRARPSRELILHLAEHLEIPLRERNQLLLAAGFAPLYAESSLDRAEMAPVRAAIDKILAGHEPFPAVVVDRRWDIVSANRPALAILSEGVDPALLRPPVNALRVSLHPDGLARRIVNFAEWAAHLVQRLHRQATVSGDPDLAALEQELRSYAGVEAASAVSHDVATQLFVPLRLRAGTGELTFFSTIATFGTALDITVSELAIESFFPGDEVTAQVLRDAWSGA